MLDYSTRRPLSGNKIVRNSWAQDFRDATRWSPVSGDADGLFSAQPKLSKNTDRTKTSKPAFSGFYSVPTKTESQSNLESSNLCFRTRQTLLPSLPVWFKLAGFSKWRQWGREWCRLCTNLAICHDLRPWFGLLWQFCSRKRNTVSVTPTSEWLRDPRF